MWENEKKASCETKFVLLSFEWKDKRLSVSCLNVPSLLSAWSDGSDSKWQKLHNIFFPFLTIGCNWNHLSTSVDSILIFWQNKWQCFLTSLCGLIFHIYNTQPQTTTHLWTHTDAKLCTQTYIAGSSLTIFWPWSSKYQIFAYLLF